MKIKSTIAGLIVVASMAVMAPSQAGEVCTVGVNCGHWDVPYSGTGWSMIPCGTVLQPAVTWQQYTSGTYAPPSTNRGFLGM